jgi:phosphopantetheine adenylyltransferase
MKPRYFDDVSIVEKNAIASFEVDNLIDVNELKRLIFELKDRMELASKELVSHLDNIDITSGISYKDLFYKDNKFSIREYL